MASNTPDNHAYKGWMNSDSFIKRAFGVFGYSFVAGLIVQVVLFVVIFVFAMLIGGTAMLFNR